MPANIANRQDFNTSDRRGVSRQFTQEIANEVGIALADYNPDLKSRDAGRIGGRITQRLVEAGKSQLGENLR
ncbi:MAG TPA: small, acid-soluble spore protein, alpha/beta type [Clostridiaceae bacterium]|nr:small, acid-soluble spore protein, alpha/beta type [Clostridiaceae bacterium]